MLNTKLLGAVSSPPAEYVEDVFSTYLYTGNGSTQTITNDIDLAGEGGLTWIKSRSDALLNCLFDTNRGGDNRLVSSSTGAQSNSSTFITSFNSNGFSLGSNTQQNSSGSTFCSWTFRKAPKFFDVVTYTGDGSGYLRRINHSLASKPGLVIIKCTSDTGDWHTMATLSDGTQITGGGTGLIFGLNLTNQYYSTITAGSDLAVSTTSFAPEVIGGFDGALTNASGKTYVAYLFAHNAGGFGAAGTDNVISCGSFTSDASENATVSLGYEPQYVMFKRSSGVGDWKIVDVMRGMSLTENNHLIANSSAAESVVTPDIKPTATGFTVSGVNASSTFIYMAIRRPMKPPTSGTQVFSPLTRTGNSATTTVNAGFAPDMVFTLDRQYGGNPSAVHNKLSGALVYLNTAGTDAETSLADGLLSYNNNGIVVGADSSGLINFLTIQYVYHFFRRATGFMDVVSFIGSGTARTVAHNLGAVPELMIVKARSSVGDGDWWTYSNTLGATKYLRINLDSASATFSGLWNNTSPTSTNFTVGTYEGVNNSGSTYVAYLFASVAGVSKVGSYTGNGSSQTINCGFTAGARYVLIKRTDSTGNWFVWDTARGIVSGNDPYLLLNSTAAEVTTNDSIDPDNSGFVVNQLSATNINVSSATYIYLAIA